MTRRPIIGAGAALAAIAVVIATALVLALSPSRPPGIVDTSRSPDASVSQGPTARPTVRPEPGHEVFGFVPYWEMDSGIAAHLADTDLSTLALFSVTHRRNGSINTTQTGYERITGAIGTQLIREAHDRGVDVQLVFTSFGTTKNERFFGSLAAQDVTIEALVTLAADIGVDGINVDVERLSPTLVPAFGTFVGRLRDALRDEIPKAKVSAATGAGRTGAAMAVAASLAGADRIFLMGYDYHYGGSQVGASAPISRRDGSRQDLIWSLDMYETLGVPLEKTLLGLPLYGLRWRVEGPEIASPRLGNGAIWVPADNPKFLASPPLPPELDPIEIVEFYAVAPTVSPRPGDSRATAGWQAIYVDSPRTLGPKLALADERGLAGAGFWAIGYERGLPDYSELIKRFRAGKLE